MARFPVETSKGKIGVLSQGEAVMMRLLDKNSWALAKIVGYDLDVVSWEYEPRSIILTPDFDYDGKHYRSSSYTPDFVVQTAQGFTLYVEIKGWNTFRREEEQLKEKDFIYRWILPNQATARYVKLILSANGLVRDVFDKQRRSENNINKSKTIRATWTQISHLLKGKKHEKIDIDSVLKITAHYRKNFRVAAKKDFIRQFAKEITLLANSDNPQSETCYNEIRSHFDALEKELKGYSLRKAG